MEKKDLFYVNFHSHGVFSNLSMLDGYGTVEQTVLACKDQGYPGVVLTDHGSVSGHLKLIKTCKEHNLKPICGCEMYAVEDLEEMKKVRDKIAVTKAEEQVSEDQEEYKEDEKSKARKKMHFNVIAKNQKGLLALWKLVSISWMDGFYAKPSIDWKLLEKEKGNLLYGTACESGPIGKALDHEKLKYDKKVEKEERELELFINQTNKEIIGLEGKISNVSKITELENQINFRKEEFEKNKKIYYKEFELVGKNTVRKVLTELKGYFGNDLYVEIIPIPEERARWKFVWSFEIAKELGILCIGTNDSHYPRKEDSKFQDVLYCNNLRRSKKNITFYDENRKRYTPGLFYNHSAIEMYERLKSTFPEFSEDEVISLVNNTKILFDQIETVVEPKVPAVAFEVLEDEEGKMPTNLYHKIIELIKEGWNFRGLEQLLSADEKIQYHARITRELEVILNKGYIDYFMIMRDIMNWCETDRPFIEHFDKWFERNGEFYHPGKTKEEVFEIIKEKGLLSPKKPIATGIARGSAGGSLVAYLLRITNIDPMPLDLLFERFIDYTRGNVYYKLNFDNYSKPQFLKEFPEENLENLKQLEEKYKPLLVEKIKNLLNTNKWYNNLQIKREFWLLDHNQEFSREKEYFYTIFDKYEKKEIIETEKNENNSILSWLAGFTKEEPIGDYVVNLTDIPDIDSDFEDARRNEVYYYLIHRYGIHNSCRIATYGELKDKSGLDMLVRIFGEKDPSDDKGERTKPEIIADMKDIKAKIEEYKKVVEVKSTQSIKKKHVKGFLETIENEYKEKYPWIWEFWEAMFGQVISMGMHAAGMIVHNKPIVEYGALYRNKDKETGENLPVIAWDKIESEGMGLMKLDILGLNTCGNIRETQELVEKRHGWKHNWQMIPNIYNDQKTKDLLKKGDVVGLFQLEGGTMNGLTHHLEPETLEEVILINAGGRPGPLEYIHSLKYKDKKNGLIEPFYFDNEVYKNITKDRYGLLIYQEDIMAISRDMCKYNPYMVGKIRKMVGKATSGGLDELEEDFKNRLIEHSQMTPENAQELWNYIKSFGTYCFNKAHAAAYGMFAWIQGYYKSNYPLEFYAGTLKTLPDKSEEKINLLLKDYKEHGYELLPPDINKSRINFEINKDENGKELIRVGFLYIKGLGTKQADEIQRKQPFLDYKDFIKRIDKRIVNASVRQIAKDVGLFNSIGGAPLIDEKLVPAIEFLEFLQDFPEILNDLFENYTPEKINDLFLDFGVKENKLPMKKDEDELNLDEILNDEEKQDENFEHEKTLDYDIYKQIITKIKSKLTSLYKGIEKGKINKSEVAIGQNYLNQISEIKEKIENGNELIVKELNLISKKIKNNEIKIIEILDNETILSENSLKDLLKNIKELGKIKWKKENREKDIIEGIQEEDKAIIKETFEMIGETYFEFSKDTFLEEKDKLEKKLEDEYNLTIERLINEIEKKDKIEYLKLNNLKIENENLNKELSNKLILLYNENLKNEIKQIENLIKEIVLSLNINKENQIVKIDAQKAIKYCPILLNVDLSKYGSIVSKLKYGLVGLKNIDKFPEIENGNTGGMILDINILQEQPTPFKKRVHLVIMSGEIQKSVFVNGSAYEKNQVEFDKLKIGDPVLIRFKKTQKFPVINLMNICNLDTLYNKVEKNIGTLNQNDSKFLK